MNFKTCFAVLVFATIAAAGSASATCSNATLTGVWGYWVGAVGQFTADGNRHITAGSQTASESGTIVNQTYTGTYSLAKNCIGSLTLNLTGGGGGTFTGNFILDQLNQGIEIISTASGSNGSGFGAAGGTVTCGMTGKKVTYAVFLVGKYPGTGTSVDHVFQLILDGKGNISGSGTFDVGGTITTTSISGPYTESSNCTGTAKIKVGTNTLNLNFVVAAAGKEIFAIETDSGTSVGGFGLQ